jgi:hypothetical protein
VSAGGGAIRSLAEDLRPLVVGEDGDRLEALWQRL